MNYEICLGEVKYELVCRDIGPLQFVDVSDKIDLQNFDSWRSVRSREPSFQNGFWWRKLANNVVPKWEGWFFIPVYYESNEGGKDSCSKTLYSLLWMGSMMLVAINEELFFLRLRNSTSLCGSTDNSTLKLLWLSILVAVPTIVVSCGHFDHGGYDIQTKYFGYAQWYNWKRVSLGAGIGNTREWKSDLK